ncbi:MAG: hypothetical protein ABIF08_03615 [Nanoarchaeota archaeon]
MIRALLPIFLIFMLVLVSGCTQAPDDLGDDVYDENYVEPTITPMEDIEYVCKTLCQEQLDLERDISNGPCLGNDVGELPEGEIWVCDIAHNPRQDTDNFPENQCEDYAAGIAKHFIEVDEDCNVIRAI